MDPEGSRSEEPRDAGDARDAQEAEGREATVPAETGEAGRESPPPAGPRPPWLEALDGDLRRGPEPEASARRAAGLVEALGPERLGRVGGDPARQEAVRALLCASASVAPFLGAHLRRHPEWLESLVDSDLARPRQRDELAAACARALDEAEPDQEADALRRVKYRELLRLSARDVWEAYVPLERSGETLDALSMLADVLLDAALGVARRRIEARFGPPCWRDAQAREQRLGFCVLGLGKLGGEELNYSSDVDLVYVYEAPPGPLQPETERPAPADYFTRLIRAFGPLVTRHEDEGFLYRIDLELRPEGTRGPPVVSSEALRAYYESSADPWEKAAFMKARPVAGDLALGWRVIRALSPVIYRSHMDLAAVRAIRGLKQRVARERGARDGAFDVKIDAGGIRDVEYTAQAMQLLHGGRIPQLRGRSTRGALRSLAEVDLLEPEVADGLLDAYLFLRRLENRIQMEAERQSHELPADPAARERLARALGFPPESALADFEARLAACRERVQAPFEGFLSEEGSGGVAELLARALPRLAALDSGRTLLEGLATSIERALADSPDPERALVNLERFLRGLGGRSFYAQLLVDRPELVPRLVSLFASSRFLSDILARHPRLIEPLFDRPERLLLSLDELREDWEALRDDLAPDPTDVEARLAALRLFHHRQIANVGLLDVAGEVDRDGVERALSDLAQVLVEAALAFGREQLDRARSGLPEAARDAAFLVVGLGKLGSREMGYGSDLDLVFLYALPEDAPGAAVATAQDHFVRVAQRLISALQTETAEGSCYEIDARMRPSGNQGTLVTSFAAFRRYHQGEAQVWERQALLRARAVAGDPELARAFEAERRRILERPLPPDAREESRRIRTRMELELAREDGARHDFKLGRGGVLDVENASQLLRLIHGPRHPELLEATPTGEQLEALARLGLLAPEDAEALRTGWEFLRRLSASLRVVENRSISDLDEERGDLDGLARRLGYESSRRESEGRRALLRDYRRHTDAIRAAYERVTAAAEET